MQEYPKKIKKLIREFTAEAHERELAVDVLKTQKLPVRELQWKMIFSPYAFFPEIMLL